MGVIGTFGTYSSAILGIHVAQTAMQVTGNNIGNMNTPGYTRQRVDQVSMYSSGEARYQNSFNQNIGYGAYVDSVSQLRDPYLDIRYRNDNSSLGYYEAMQEGFNQLAHIFDEVGKGDNQFGEDFGVVIAQLGELKDALRDLLQHPGSTQHDDLVNAAASTLCRLLNNAAKQVEEVRQNEEARMLADVDDINRILLNIRDLDEQIRTHSIYDDPALELRDARNLQIDKLSKYMKLDVTYSYEKLDGGKQIEKLTISLADTKDPNTGKPYVLVDGIYATQFLMPEKTPKVNPDYDPTKPTAMMYENAVTHEPTNVLSEARQVNNDYDPSLADKPNSFRNFRYMASDEAKEKYDAGVLGYPAVLKDGDNYYTDNPTYANVLYNKDFDPTDPAGYKYIADPDIVAPEGKEIDAVGKKNDPMPDYMVMEKDGVYYTNIWTLEEDEEGNRLDSFAMDEDNFAEGSGSNRYLFTLDALKDKRDFIQYEGTDLESLPVELGDNDLYGALQALRELLTEEAEFSSVEDLYRDPNAATKRGIPFYQHMLDSFAQQFANIFNSNNQMEASMLNKVYEMNGADEFLLKKSDPAASVEYIDDITDPENPVRTAVKYSEMVDLAEKIADPENNYEDFPVDDDSYEEYQKDIQKYQKMVDALRDYGQLTEEYDFYDGGVLFSNSGNSNDCSNITAMNISVSHAWSEGEVRVLNTKQPNFWSLDEEGNPVKQDSSTLNDNIAHMMSLMDQKLEYVNTNTVRDAYNVGNNSFFSGTFQEMYRRSSTLLANDSQKVNISEDAFSLMTLSLDNDRMSVSSVDLNEETMDMMKYSQAFSAACQLLTTIDSMLDRLINNTI